MTQRRAKLAGTWYPGDEGTCRQKIEQLLGPRPERAATVGVVPHAGWDFSGPLAAAVFQALAAAEPAPELLLLFGTHMAPHSPPHISLADTFETPLGSITADTELATELASALDLGPDPADSPMGGADNTVEVQLPLIKHLLPEVKVVVIGPPASTSAIEIGREAIRRARERGVPFAVVGSTDLTHYGRRFDFAPKGYGDEAARWVREENDAAQVERMLAIDPEGVLEEAARHRNACVPGAAAAALSGARELGLSGATLLDYKTSYDIHPGDTFVGYAAVVAHG